MCHRSSCWFLLFLIFLPALVAREVTSFGAKGDGRTDDTSAIQRAVAAGGGVTFPTGTYRITGTVTIDLDQTGFVSLVGDGTARIVMVGAGPAFLFIGNHAGSASPAETKPNLWERQRFPGAIGLEIVGAHPEAEGIAAKGTFQITLSRLLVREVRHAIRLFERNRNVLITECHLYHNRGCGVLYDAVNLHQTNITGSHISYNAGGGVVVRGGNVRNLQIGNCDIEMNMAPDTPPTANVLLDCTGGSVGEVAITGCTLQHTEGGPDSANIRILGAGLDPATARTPARTTQEGHVTITGNVLSDVQVNVHLVNARGVTLTGNTFWMGFKHDLLVEDCANVIVGPNNFDRNPRYGYSGRRPAGGVIFRRSRDCVLSGLAVSGVLQPAAAVLIEGCQRLNITDGFVLDSDGVGLKLQDTSLSRVSGWMIRDDRAESNSAPSLVVVGGRGNVISGNMLDRAPNIEEAAASARDNEIVKPVPAAPVSNRKS